MQNPALTECYITAALDARPYAAPDPAEEKRAIQELAARMVDHPEEILPRFVDLAMALTGGVSAGISLLEELPAPGVFRWCFLRGTLASFEGATTPRHHSPCGVTLDQNRPVLAHHPERFYDWIADAKIVVPEVLLVPLYISGSAPLGTLWIVSAEEGHFHRGHARSLTELATFVGIAARMVRTERQLEKALENQATLTREMSHRLKNVFAITDGMIQLTSRGTSTKEEFVEILSGRLHALASAHTLVSRTLHEVGHTPRASDIDALIRAVLRPHDTPGDKEGSRFTLEGPPVRCGDQAINSIALVFHELATNAVKYGALKHAEGSVRLSWREENDKLVLEWSEHGSPDLVTAPAADGFGGSLIRGTVKGLGGTVTHDWKPEGVEVRLTVPMSRLAV